MAGIAKEVKAEILSKVKAGQKVSELSKQHELVFVEVKRRRTSHFDHPASSVGYKKMRSLCRVALTYCQNHGYHFDLRFDIISLVGTNIEHFKNITWLT